MDVKEFVKELKENRNVNKVLRDLKKAESRNDLSNLRDVISTMKRDKDLKDLVYLATELEKAAEEFEMSGDDDDYDAMQDAYDKLRANLRK